MSKLEVYHQCGNNTVWNIDSFTKDNVGNGLILSPSDIKKEDLEKLDSEIKKCSMFDSQFYLPRSNKPKIMTYEFFPSQCIEDEYSTKNYEEVAYENAEKCIKFQLQNQFKNIIIPTVYAEDYTSNYLEGLKYTYVLPFIEESKKLGIDKKIFLTMIIKDSYLKDENIEKELLSFATNFQNIDGIYLIPVHKETNKRIKDEEYLFRMMRFIDILRDNDLLVHLGYTDIEALVLSIAGITSLSIGTYENTKCFGIDKFVKAEGKKQGPTPRIFSAALLQNIEYRFLPSLKTLYDKYNMLFDENKYRVEMFEPTFNWHFSKPAIYKHYFISYNNILIQLPESYEEKYNFILDRIQKSMIYFKEISEVVLLDEKNDGDHLVHWINAMRMFDKYKKSK